MSFEIEQPESMDTGGGNFLKEPGWFHLAVMEVEEEPKDANGAMLSGFRVHFEVQDGEVKDQFGKSVSIMFWNPKLTDKNNGEMAKKRQSRYAFEACGLKPGEPGGKVTVNLQDTVHRQLVAKLDLDDDGKYLRIQFCDIHHVDDPAVARVPKSASALSLLPPEQRRKPESFAKPRSKSSSNGGGSSNGNGSTEKKPAAPAQPASTVDVSDL